METLRLILGIQVASSLVLAATFATWFLVRDRRTPDQACAVVAHLAVTAQILPHVFLGKLNGLGMVTVLPGIALYLWFMALWSARRHRSRIQAWGRTRGYHITTIDLDPTLGPRFKTEYRLIARRTLDGQILTGRAVFIGRQLDVSWSAIPDRNKLNAVPPDASKQ